MHLYCSTTLFRTSALFGSGGTDDNAFRTANEKHARAVASNVFGSVMFGVHFVELKPNLSLCFDVVGWFRKICVHLFELTNFSVLILLTIFFVLLMSLSR